MTSDLTRHPTTDATTEAAVTAGHGRRAVLRGAAVLGALGVTGTLAGCGGGDEEGTATAEQPAGGQPAGGQPAGGQPAEGQPAEGQPAGGGGKVLGPATDIPVGGGKLYRDDKVVVTQPSMGEYKAFSAICTHEACVVAAVTKTIDCACHGSKFSITDGSVTQPPAGKPLEAKTVSVTGGQVSVTL